MIESTLCSSLGFAIHLNARMKTLSLVSVQVVAKVREKDRTEIDCVAEVVNDDPVFGSWTTFTFRRLTTSSSSHTSVLLRVREMLHECAKKTRSLPCGSSLMKLIYST